MPIRRDTAGLAFAAQALVRAGPVDETFVAGIAAVLGIDRDEIVDSQWVDNGPGWVRILLHDAASVLRIEPDFTRLA